MRKKIKKVTKKEAKLIEEKKTIKDGDHTNIIVYSGGYDSTLVIHELLTRYPKTHFTIVGYNTNYFNPKKNRAENLYREKYIDYLYNEAKICNFNYVKIDSEKFNNSYDKLTPFRDGGLVQQPYFVFMTSYFAPTKINHIFTGFHNGDCYFNWRDSFDSIIKAMSEIMGKELYYHHPLAKTDKFEIIKAIQTAGLEEFCFTCENPGGYFESCGECKPCTELIMAKKRISHSRRKKIDVNLIFDLKTFEDYWENNK